MACYTIFEILTYTPEQLREREVTMTRQERWLESGLAPDGSSLRHRNPTPEKSKDNQGGK
jgi:hypothetical protein